MTKNYTKLKPLDFVLKVIRETPIYKRKLLASNTGLDVDPQMDLFTGLSAMDKGRLRKGCAKQLTQSEKGHLMQVFCVPRKHEEWKTIHESLFDLIATLRDKYLDEPSVFRKEGDKETYNKLVDKMINEKNIDFYGYNVLVLGSTLKSYIRDYLDGLFDASHLSTAVNRIRQNQMNETDKICRYLIFSLNPQKRRCLLALRDLFDLIVENKGTTRMDYDSLCNIFCLTMTPQCVFDTVDVIPSLVFIFKALLRLDMYDISDIKEIISRH